MMSPMYFDSKDTVVTARGSNFEFKRGDNLTKGYIARFKDGQALTPSRMVLQDKNEKMLCLTPQKRHMLVRMDTETGKSLSEMNLRFHSEVDEDIATVVPLKKFSQFQVNTNGVVQLVGASKNTVFNMDWDTRMKDGPIVISEEKRFTKPSKMAFTSVATTSDGHVVAGGSDGVVRLFSSPAAGGGELKRAKTALNQLADPVRGVDCSANGEWVIWTTKEYVAVVNTVHTTKNNEKTLGFERAMQGDSRPDALVLRISEADKLKHGITEVDFTAARFDNGPSADVSNHLLEQETIVASTGPFIVRWKFRNVKLEYAKERTTAESFVAPIITKQQDTIVDKAFEFGSKGIVTAFSSAVARLSFDDDE